MHFAATHYLIFPDYRNVVFALAGDHAGIAAIALGGVDGHRPLVAFVVAEFLEIFVQRKVPIRRLIAFPRKGGIFLVLLQRRRRENFAAFNVVVILRASDRIFVAG